MPFSNPELHRESESVRAKEYYQDKREERLSYQREHYKNTTAQRKAAQVCVRCGGKLETKTLCARHRDLEAVGWRVKQANKCIDRLIKSLRNERPGTLMQGATRLIGGRNE